MTAGERACACGTCPSCSGEPVRPAIADPLVYRHGAIKARMLARIGRVEIDGERPLKRLSTRDSDDPAIALIDAFAGSLHILAYSAARLSDDSSIVRTGDRDALANLTRMLGYEPRPALSASTTLAFAVNTLEGAPTRATVPAGTKVASVPGQDELPQTFETDAELEARAEWNALKPVLPKAVPMVTATTPAIVVAGTGTAAKVGDALLAYLSPQPGDGTSWLLARIAAIVRDSDSPDPHTIFELASPAALPAPAALQGPAFANRVIILGQRAAAFGSTAPDLQLLSEDVRDGQTPANATKPATEWSGLVMDTHGTATGGTVDLDAVYPDAMEDRILLFSTDSPDINRIGRITKSAERSRSEFGLSAKVSRITVDGIDLTLAGFSGRVRETTIFIETGRESLLELDADIEMPPAPRDRLVVAGAAALPPGRRVVLTGRPWGAAAPEASLSEVATVKSAAAAGAGATELIFERPIAGRFHSTTLTLLANSVAASHGETRPNVGAEPVGSGDASRPAPRYRLQASPLAYVPAANERGYAPAVAVRVNDRLYEEKPSLHGLEGDARAFTVRTVADQKSELQFAGRLPSGVNNIAAVYRVGSGRGGNLEAGRLSTLMTPVLGITAVANPVPAEGGSDAETLEDLRSSAPQSIRTLDRVVSLSDYEVFARRFRGIGKALATELQAGMRSVVLLTVATTDLDPPAPGSDTIEGLRAALARISPPRRLVRIEGFDSLVAQLTIALATDPMLRRADVEAAVRAALARCFGREARGFGEALHESAILAEVQKVEGVIAARIAAFGLSNGAAAIDGRLLSPAPSLAKTAFTRAGLLWIDPAAIAFAEMQP